ncbi:hypothetical protein D9M72_578770 [compost metagenome]
MTPSRDTALARFSSTHCLHVTCADLSFGQSVDDDSSEVLSDLCHVIGRVQQQDGSLGISPFTNDGSATHADPAYGMRNCSTEPLASTDATMVLARKCEQVNVFLVRENLLVDVSEPLHHGLRIKDAVQEGLLVSITVGATQP